MGVLRTIREMRTMDEGELKGNVSVSWHPDEADEVEAAERTFNRYLEAGWMAFAIEASEGRRVQIFAFNPELETIVLLPPMGGG